MRPSKSKRSKRPCPLMGPPVEPFAIDPNPFWFAPRYAYTRSHINLGQSHVTERFGVRLEAPVRVGLSSVYGYPGDGVGGLDVALENSREFMHYVQVRHEEMAAFMASAHAKFTGQPGLCYATSGPDAIHLLTGLYDARADHVPVVAIVGQQARSALGSSYQQEVDLQTLFADVTEYVMTATVPGQVRTLIDRAVRIAQTKRAVTCVIIPNDLQELTYEDLPMVHGATHTGVG